MRRYPREKAAKLFTRYVLKPRLKSMFMNSLKWHVICDEGRMRGSVTLNSLPDIMVTDIRIDLRLS